MRGALVVVVDVALNAVAVDLVAEAFEDRLQFVVREQVEQHQDVGLFRQLVAIRRIALGLENTIESLDVGVLLGVPDPIKLFEISVPVELADDAVIVEGNLQLSADLVPPDELLALDAGVCR